MPFAFDHATKGMPTKMSVEFYICGIRFYMSIEFIDDFIISEGLTAYLSKRPTSLYARSLTTVGGL